MVRQGRLTCSNVHIRSILLPVCGFWLHTGPPSASHIIVIKHGKREHIVKHLTSCAETAAPTYILTPGGGSHTHSPVVRFAYMCSLVLGSMISTHSHLKERNIVQRVEYRSNPGQIILNEAVTPMTRRLLPSPSISTVEPQYVQANNWQNILTDVNRKWSHPNVKAPLRIVAFLNSRKANTESLPFCHVASILQISDSLA